MPTHSRSWIRDDLNPGVEERWLSSWDGLAEAEIQRCILDSDWRAEVRFGFLTCSTGRLSWDDALAYVDEEIAWLRARQRPRQG